MFSLSKIFSGNIFILKSATLLAFKVIKINGTKEKYEDEKLSKTSSTVTYFIQY